MMEPEPNQVFLQKLLLWKQASKIQRKRSEFSGKTPSQAALAGETKVCEHWSRKTKCPFNMHLLAKLISNLQ